MIQTTQFAPNFYLLYDGRVRQFLLTEPERALLIDTGFPDSGVARAVAAITDAPVTVVLTHGDRDHTGGLADFGTAYLHRADWPLVEGRTFRPLAEGDVFTCGGYRLEVLEIPGHTAGSIALLDREKRLLLPGDSVQKRGPIYMFSSRRDLGQYLQSLRRLAALEPEIDTVLPCHHEAPIPAAYITKTLRDAEALRRGELPWEVHDTLPCRLCHGRDVDFYADLPQA